MSDWYVGQKVVHVRGPWAALGHGTEKLPVDGHVYTIREIRPYEGFVGFMLEEIRNRRRRYGNFGICEPDFNERVFRPVVDQNADISVFTKLLEPLSNREPVDA
jgi:hypothetical protein